MKPTVTRYLFFILLPVVIAFSSGLLLKKRTMVSESLESATRLGNLTTVLLRGEISDLSVRLARQAAPLENPDSSSPVVQAVLGGDTVAALGTMSGELVLTVALAEARVGMDQREIGGPPRVRAISALFPASSVTSLRVRSGFGAALYFRRGRVSGRGGPEEFGPSILPSPEPGTTGNGRTTFSTSLGPAVLLPLDSDHPGFTGVQLLVAPGEAGFSAPSPLAGSLILLASCGLGFAILLRGTSRPGRGGAPLSGSLFASYFLPLGALWIALFLSFGDSVGGAKDFGRVEMVRALGLLRDTGNRLDVDEIGGATGFGVTRLFEGRTLESTLDDRLLNQALAELAPPPPSLPATGTLGQGTKAVAFASMLEDTGTILMLTGDGYEKPLRFLRLLQAGLGGVASILGLVFVFSAARPHRGREEMRQGRSAAHGP